MFSSWAGQSADSESELGEPLSVYSSVVPSITDISRLLTAWRRPAPPGEQPPPQAPRRQTARRRDGRRYVAFILGHPASADQITPSSRPRAAGSRSLEGSATRTA